MDRHFVLIKSGSFVFKKLSLVALTSFLLAQTASAQSGFIKISAVGDMMIGLENKYPTQNYFSQVMSQLNKSDITFGNMEGTLCDQPIESAKCDPESDSCHAFKSPSHLTAQFKEAGFDVLSIANNHIMDYGQVCANETLKNIEEYGIKAIGLRNTKNGQDIETVRKIEYKNKTIVFFGFHYNNGSGRTINLHDELRIAKLIKIFNKPDHILVASFHGGAESVESVNVPNEEEVFFGEKRGDLRRFTHFLVDQGVDLVIGHGPHVLRGLELYKNRLVIYSLGNFANYTGFSLSSPRNLGAIIEAELSTDGEFVSGEVIPTIQRKLKSTGEIKLEIDSKYRAVDLIKKLSIEDFNHTIDLQSNGRINHTQ